MPHGRKGLSSATQERHPEMVAKQASEKAKSPKGFLARHGNCRKCSALALTPALLEAARPREINVVLA
jgi:hypothetical protein